jgi:hypothetical protein
LKKRLGVLSVVTILVMAFFALSAAATNSELYFSSDKNGQTRVTNVQEGSQVWMVVHDPDENIDCDVRDKFWTDAKVFDPKTGAYINWAFAPHRGTADVAAYGGYKPGHNPGAAVPSNIVYFEETGADTGLFVSSQPMQIGTRLDYRTDNLNTHWVGLDFAGVKTWDPAVNGFHGPLSDALNSNFGQWEYILGDRQDPNKTIGAPTLPSWVNPMHGRFENMDTLIGMVVDQNDPTDVATAMMKIIDTQATITWDQQIYKDANGSATITVTDADENLNCNEVEYVPVFIIVNPESWNPVQTASNWDSPTGFCALKRTGGVVPGTGTLRTDKAIAWYNIYDSGEAFPASPAMAGNYYMQYPVQSGSRVNVTYFDTVDDDGVTEVMFYAQETGVNTGVFQLNLNSILVDLGFNSLAVRDVLVAYYLDPNDEDDFQVGAAYIEEKQHSITSFTDATRQDKKLFWIGRDPVYVQVIDSNANVDPCCPEQVVVSICDPHEWDDAEWLILDETSSNSPVFFSNAGTELLPVWDAMGIGNEPSHTGGYQLKLDNWKLEVYNEDHVYVQYNDVYYTTDIYGMGGLGDETSASTYSTAFPPRIDRIRVANDVSFDLMEIGDTQVYNGQTVTMYFLDRQGNRVSGYVNSDCVFIEVVDADQNEDTLRRERIDGFWDDHQNLPFGPQAVNGFICGWTRTNINPINALLGDTNIFSTTAETPFKPNDQHSTESHYSYGFPKIYVLNPRSGQWAALDLLETGVATGDFVSVICVDLVNVYTCVPTLGALPGDTIVAFYQDPSNHSDSAMIQLKVGIGGGTTPPSQSSTTTFTNATGAAVLNYTDADLVYVKVVDPSHAGATTLANAVTIGAVTYSLAPLAGATNDTFITIGLDLNLTAGASISATYKDPTDPTDTSSDTITVIASKLDVTSFYAGPNPSAGDVTFAYKGSGIASVMSVAVYDLAGHLVWASELANVTSIVWNGKDDGGAFVANGAYIYLVTATDGTDTFPGKGTLFINR